MNSVVDIGVDPLAILLHMFLKLLPGNVCSEMSDLPDCSPGAHVGSSLREGVRGSRGQHCLSCLLALTLLTTTTISHLIQS